MNSRAKGCRVEREAAKYLTRIGFPAERSARNGVRDGSDLIIPSIPMWSVEVKGNESIDVGTRSLTAALEQARRRPGRPAVLWKHNRKPWRLSVEIQGHIATFSGDDAIRHVLRDATIGVGVFVIGGGA